MSGRLISATPSAYQYPLLIKHLLHSSMLHAADQEIVYRDQKRFTYRTLRERIGRLASGLAALGVRPGDTVGVMDWDTHRFLEAFFAIPMMGAILQTVNVRLSHEQIIYTIEHAGATTLLVNDDFRELLAAIRPRLTKVKTIILMSDSDTLNIRESDIAGHYEDMLASGSPDYDFPDFDENTQATTFYTSGTTGKPKGVYYSHRQMVLHTISELAAFGLAPKQGRFHSESVYMPITPMFHVHAWGIPLRGDGGRREAGLPGTLRSGSSAEADQDGRRHLHPLRADDPAHAARRAGQRGRRPERPDDGHRGAALPKMLALRAMARGIDIFTGYGMSETGPVLTLAHLKASMLSGVHDEEVNFRTKTGRPIPLVDIRVVDADMNDVAHDGKASGEIVVSGPVADAGLLRQSDGVRGSVARRLSAHQRYRQHDGARLPPDHRPHQGRHQDRRRVDLLAAARRHHHEGAGRQGGRGHRRQGREVGRAARRPRRPRSTRRKRRRRKTPSRRMSAASRTRARSPNTAFRRRSCSSISSSARASARSTRSCFASASPRTSSASIQFDDEDIEGGKG